MTDARAAKTPRILCAGGAVQDFVMRVECFPEPGTKVQASDFVITIGGQAGNAAVAAARLGARVSFAGPVGDDNDEFAVRIRTSLENENVDCSGALRVPGAMSSVSLILLDAAGEKTIATRRDQGLSDIVPPDPAAAVADVDVVLLDNRYPNYVVPIGAAALARGIPRVLDLDRAAAPDDPLLTISSHVIASADALRKSSGADDLPTALKRFAQRVPGFLAVTNGPAGTFWLDNGAVRHLPAFKVNAVDTLGAGDTFHAAFAFRFVETGDEIEAMRFASAAAAIKCTRFGGLKGAATRAEVEAFLARN